MPNVSRINGFRPVKHVAGAPYNGQGNLYAVAASDGTALFVGDPVALDGGATVQGLATVTKANVAGPVLGVVVGFAPINTDVANGSITAGSVTLDTPQFRAASTARLVWVEDSPDVIYEVEQATGSNAVYTFLPADVGLNASHSTVAGSTATGNSGATLDMATKATTATLPWKLLGAVQRIDQDMITAPVQSTKVLVLLNQSTLGGGTGSTGI